MAKTKQEKEDAKREREYEKKHKRKYRLTPGDIVFYIFLCQLGRYMLLVLCLLLNPVLHYCSSILR